jgi:hypothetical protein
MRVCPLALRSLHSRQRCLFYVCAETTLVASNVGVGIGHIKIHKN